MKKIRYRLVYNRKGKLNKQGTALIQIEALLNKRKAYFSTNIYVRPNQWSKRDSSVIEHPHATDLNSLLFEMIMDLESIELQLWKRGITPTLAKLRELIKAGNVRNLSFESFCLNAIEQSTRTSGTKYNLRNTLDTLKEFRPGYTWEDIGYSFVKEFEVWLQNKGYAINTVAKHLRQFRTLINEAISGEYLSADDNPFLRFHIKHEQTEHVFLNPSELHKFERLKVSGKEEKVKDAFLFCSYTGFRYSDFISLKTENITNINNHLWIKMKTQKTGINVEIPISLLFDGRAVSLIEKYNGIENLNRIGCNADTNKVLHILRKKAGIDKAITFHTARHTCATLLCYQGVPITTVQRILGHTKLTTTQIYSEIMPTTIIKDLESVKKRVKR